MWVDMDIVKALAEDRTVLLLMPSTEYNDMATGIAKQLAESGLCYVTLNKTFGSLRENFEKNGIDTRHIVFIDGISKRISAKPMATAGSYSKNDKENAENKFLEAKTASTSGSEPKPISTCYFAKSPGAIAELTSLIQKSAGSGIKYLVFDSLTNMLIYQKHNSVIKFAVDIVNKIKASETRAVFFALNLKEHESIIKECGTFFDRIIDLSK